MIIKTKTHARKRWLLSGAGTALAFTLATLPAYGQTASGRTTGDTVLTNSQSMPSGIVLARNDGASIEGAVTGQVAGSTVALDGNAVMAKARANSATLTLAPDAAATPAGRPTSLSAGSVAVDATANNLIANQQNTGSAESVADVIDAPISISALGVSAGALALTGNEQTASAEVNAATTAIDLNGAGGSGAGIVSTQTSGPGGGVAARVRRGATLDTGAISGSSLTISGNSNGAEPLFG